MPRLEPAEGLPRTVVSRGSTADNRTASWRDLSPQIDAARCNGCLICWKLCPESSVRLIDGKPVIDLEHCKGCGLCAHECPIDCIAMQEELH